MVAKMSSGSSPYGALSYNQTKLDEQHAKVLFTNRMIEDKNGECSIGACMRSFEPYLLANNKTEKPILHVSLNPDPNDKLTDEQLSDIAQEYMEKMGYGNQPFIVYKHEDIDRHHLHIVSVRVDEDGKKINDSFEHRRSMDACRELEEKYGLIPADKKQRQDGLPLKPIDYSKGDVKHQIANIIRPVMKSYKFQSFNEYKTLLSLFNVHAEEIKGEVKGKPYKGIVYSALDSKGNKVGNPFKSSLFGKSVGDDSIQDRITKSAEIIKTNKLKDRTKGIVEKAMKTCKTRSDFEKELFKHNINVVFRENDSGRIYGVTFIDHDAKTALNGSRIGKEFSANVFNELYSKQPTQERTIQNENETISNVSNGKQEDNDNLAGGLFGILSPENNGVNYEEEAFINRMKKKRKRRRKL